MAGDALLQVGATVTEWSRTDYTAIVAATTHTCTARCCRMAGRDIDDMVMHKQTQLGEMYNV